MPFKKGQSGNPAGRRKGTKNKSTLFKEDIATLREKGIGQIADSIPEVLKAVIDQAKDGCRVSQKMVLERFIPAVSHNKHEHTGTLPTLIIQQVTTEHGQPPRVIDAVTVSDNDEDNSGKKKEVPPSLFPPSQDYRE